MITTFKNASAAAHELAEKLGGKVEGTTYHPQIAIDKDATIKIKMTGDHSSSAIRATIFKGEGGYGNDIGWKGIKAEEKRVHDPKNKYRDRIESYSADLDALAEKLKPLIEPLKGFAERERLRIEKESNLAANRREARRPIVDKLVELGLARFGEVGERYAERRMESAECETNPAMPFRIETHAETIKVKFEMPYDKAEEVLSFLERILKP